MHKITLGGDRLGTGKKQKVELHGYERSTHDIGYPFKTTMSAGTLVPFLCEIGMPGTTLDIDLAAEVMTHPTVGPLFDSYKLQCDVFQIPMRLYNSLLHNNALYIGMNMAQAKIPQIRLTAKAETNTTDIDNAQINPSCVLNYLGIRGVGYNGEETDKTRDFNAMFLIGLWDIYKNYYANKQEEIGAVIHTPALTIVKTVDSVDIWYPPYGVGTELNLPEVPGSNPLILTAGTKITITYTPPAAAPIPNQIMVNTAEHGLLSLEDLTGGFSDDGLGLLTGYFNQGRWGATNINNWTYINGEQINNGKPAVATFPLENIDLLRESILGFSSKTTPYRIGVGEDFTLPPYIWLCEEANDIPNMLSSQEGLPLKTYLSDLFNNWLNTEWIDGAGGITEVTAVDTTAGFFTIDELNLRQNVYKMLNRIAVSGGSYQDWMIATYDHEAYLSAESPMYMGGLVKELVFQEIVSNTQTAEQPLGTLAGKGRLAGGQKGGKVVIKCSEPCLIMGLVSLTPRINYSQGNSWMTGLQTWDDLHKPQLDEIGFQELITEQMAFWDTVYDAGTSTWVQKSVGKQPAWTNYMTNVGRNYGNFAIANNEMFMTLNRRYEYESGTGIKDLTTYIDPSKYNFIFAETALDAQNFWCQINVNMLRRAKMSGKVMPNI